MKLSKWYSFNNKFNKPKNRYQAFAVHIGISAVIFIILALIIVFKWYPGFLFNTDGGWAGIRLIAGVDFVIGPLLTLIVYKVGKPGLKFDLFLIAVIQFLCLTAGTWIVHHERPVAVIYADGTFRTMSTKSYLIHDVDINEVLKFGDKVPVWIYVDLPEDETKRLEILKNQIRVGLVYARVDLYKPYKENLETVMREDIKKTEIDEKIAGSMSNDGKLFYFTARYGDGYIEINKDTGDYISIH